MLAESGPNYLYDYEYIYADGERIALFVSTEGGPSTAHYYVNDHLGTPQRLVNQNGDSTWQAHYDAFGRTDLSIEQIAQNHRFPGQYFDAESDLYYNWNRYYDSGIGRYVTSDPIGLEGGLNTYIYVAGNPLSKFDQNGKSWRTIIQTAGVILGLMTSPGFIPPPPSDFTPPPHHQPGKVPGRPLPDPNKTPKPAPQAPKPVKQPPNVVPTPKPSATPVPLPLFGPFEILICLQLPELCEKPLMC